MIIHTTLQTNPLLVAWPVESLTWFLVQDQGRRSEQFHVSDGAISLLSAFRTPHLATDVFGANLKDAIGLVAECVDQQILLPVPSVNDPVLPGDFSSKWAGFRFCDQFSIGGTEISRPARSHELPDGEITVFDNVLDENCIVAMHRWFFQLPFRRIDADTPSTFSTRHWVNSFVPVDRFIRSVPVFRLIVDFVAAAYPNRQLMLRRIDAYGTTYGDIPLLHRDAEPGEGVTAILYGNAEWPDLWMAETVFCNDSGEATILVPPRPGRVVLFDGAIPHRASAPSRECHETRYTLVFKFVIT